MSSSFLYPGHAPAVCPEVGMCPASYARELQKEAERGFLRYSRNCHIHRTLIDDFAAWHYEMLCSSPSLRKWQRRVFMLDSDHPPMPSVVRPVVDGDSSIDLLNEVQVLNVALGGRLMFELEGRVLVRTMDHPRFNRLSVMIHGINEVHLMALRSYIK